MHPWGGIFSLMPRAVVAYCTISHHHQFITISEEVKYCLWQYLLRPHKKLRFIRAKIIPLSGRRLLRLREPSWKRIGDERVEWPPRPPPSMTLGWQIVLRQRQDGHHKRIPRQRLGSRVLFDFKLLLILHTEDVQDPRIGSGPALRKTESGKKDNLKFREEQWNCDASSSSSSQGRVGTSRPGMLIVVES